MTSDFICFDTESAQGRYRGQYIEELLEISMMDASGQELYYSRFKPAHLTRWDTKIHHITPSMVSDKPYFEECRQDVAGLFDKAQYIVGFSLIDDYKAMSRAGITDLDKKKTVELRHLYWYCYGRFDDVPFFSGPGLSACANELGVTVIDEAVHSANGDTRVTLNLFFALAHKFAEMEQYPGGCPDYNSPEFIELVELMFIRIAEAKYEYDSRCAAGYIHVVTHEDGGVRFIPSLLSTREEGDSVLTIHVNARRRAAFELEKQFNHRRILNTKNFNLTPQDLEEVKLYTNTFDNQEQMYSKLLGIQRAMVVVPRTRGKKKKKSTN